MPSSGSKATLIGSMSMRSAILEAARLRMERMWSIMESVPL